LPLLVDAAAQLPPAANLHRFIAEGADLVAFSGGKAIGGPQSSGILCGRRDLICSALLQMLDLDVFPDLWRAPADFAPLGQLPGLPQHGIGRSCKIGKEEIVGLLVALERFATQPDEARQQAWRATLEQVIASAGNVPGLAMRILAGPIPYLEVATPDANRLAAQLAAGTPAIHCSLGRRHENVLLFSPVSLTAEDARIIGERLRAN